MTGGLTFAAQADGGNAPDLADEPAWQRRTAWLSRQLPELLAELHIPGAALVLLRGGLPAWSAQFGVRAAGQPEPVSADTVFEAASMSKPLFAYLVLQQVQAGRLDLDRPVMHYLPTELFKPAQPWQALITARLLLTHRSGLPNWRSAADELSGSLRITSIPGQRFGYSGEGYFYLQRVLEHVTGLPLQALAAQQLFTPLAMQHSGFVLSPALHANRARGHDEQGQPLPPSDYPQANAAYTLYTSATDYALFLAEMLNPDRSAAHSLNAQTLQQMLSHQTVADDREPMARPGAAAGLAAHPAVFWGLGWAINTTAAQGDIAYHTGTNSSGFRNYCQFSPSRRSGLLLMCNGLSGNTLWQRVVAELGDL